MIDLVSPFWFFFVLFFSSSSHSQEGAFALAFKSRHFPGECVVTRRGSPLLVAIKTKTNLATNHIPILYGKGLLFSGGLREGNSPALIDQSLRGISESKGEEWNRCSLSIGSVKWLTRGEDEMK